MIWLIKYKLKINLRDRSYCRLAVAVHILSFNQGLRSTIIGVTQCGHYASVTLGNLQSNEAVSNNPSAKNNFKPVNEIGVTVAWLWPCIFCGLIKVLRRTTYRSNSMRPLRFCRTKKTVNQ